MNGWNYGALILSFENRKLLCCMHGNVSGYRDYRDLLMQEAQRKVYFNIVLFLFGSQLFFMGP